MAAGRGAVGSQDDFQTSGSADLVALPDSSSHHVVASTNVAPPEPDTDYASLHACHGVSCMLCSAALSRCVQVLAEFVLGESLCWWVRMFLFVLVLLPLSASE